MRLKRFVLVESLIWQGEKYVVIRDRWFRQDFHLTAEMWKDKKWHNHFIVLKDGVYSVEVGKCGTDGIGGT